MHRSKKGSLFDHLIGDWSGLYIGGFGEVSWSQTSGSAI
jgi:hypothetical protein